MRYEILGVLRIVDADEVTYISAHKMEVLLAVLLARSGQVATRDQLIDEIWGDQAPRRANAALHVYISQLRKFLHRRGCKVSPIITRPLGYLLRVDPDELDAQDFHRLMGEGRAHTSLGRHEEALQYFEAALSLWRGQALDDVRDGPIVNSYATWLEESRLQCMELLAEVYLLLGRHREVVGRLYNLTSEYPLRETFYRHLMLALYRSERQAEAVQVYRAARERLKEELGLEPCRPLRDLHQAILLGDDQLDVSAGLTADPKLAGL